MAIVPANDMEVSYPGNYKDPESQYPVLVTHGISGLAFGILPKYAVTGHQTVFPSLKQNLGEIIDLGLSRFHDLPSVPEVVAGHDGLAVHTGRKIRIDPWANQCVGGGRDSCLTGYHDRDCSSCVDQNRDRGRPADHEGAHGTAEGRIQEIF